MIKSDIVDELYRVLGGVSRREVSEYVESVFENISASLENDDCVRITRFGVFSTRHKNARMGRNPVTLEAAEISARRVVTFKASKSLLKRLNSEEADRAIDARLKAREMLDCEDD